MVSVKDSFIMTDYVFLTLLMSGAFLLDTGNSRSDESQSLLFLYFLLLFLDEACLSGPETQTSVNVVRPNPETV